ncbi:laminin B domain-containing protein [Caulobacter sp. S45]|uniref:laminin B domain-containing protein n=1 Tax=Caulobacter sp. S45 TaxID=1641861 RepID=UPI001576B7BB|nr:laminin B domain-containing protein [Caulobacter sp. S45]
MSSIRSTFTSNAGGWTISGDVASQKWVSSGGDPGGYYSWVDAATGDIDYYNAPKSFLADKSAYLGGTISYDILDTGNGLTAYDVQLVGDGHTLQYTSTKDSNFPTPNKWSAAKVYLDAGKFIDTATGTAPSVTELKATLSNLTGLEIRAEYVNGAESGGLDSVVLATKTTATAAAQLVQAAASFGGTTGALSNHGESVHAATGHFELVSAGHMALGARVA